MRFQRVGIVLLALFAILIAIFMHVRIQQEEKTRIREMKSKGSHTASLIALHSIQDFEGDRRNFFLKTFMDHAFNQGISYCFIHDQAGTQVVSLISDSMGANISDHIQKNSLAATGVINQEFQATGSSGSIHEFVKPMFENGKQTGTVRVGLILPDAPILTMERMSLLALILFLMVSSFIIVHYGSANAMKPLAQFSENIINALKDSKSPTQSSVKGLGIVSSVIGDVRQSLVQLKDKMDKISESNEKLSSRLGVLTFEKNQVLNIINTINFGVIMIDIQGNVVHVNDYVVNLLAVNHLEMIDRPLEEVLQHEEIISFITQQDVLEQPRTYNHIDTVFPELAPGETFRVTIFNLLDGERALIGKMIGIDNVTREKAAEKATQEFTAHVSHELITPLTTIKSYTEMLMDGEVEDRETQKEFYNTINDETARLERLIKDILNFSRIEMGSLALNKGLVKSEWLFEGCITAVETAAQKKNIAIQRNMPDNFPSLMGDKDQLISAIINILSNAVKYTPVNGTIHFELSEQEKMVVFEIKDTGCGMSTEDIPRIFEKFYRSSHPKVAEQQGTGLGLAITSEVIGLHGGDIEVESEIDKGTHFTVRIPKDEYYIGKE